VAAATSGDLGVDPSQYSGSGAAATPVPATTSTGTTVPGSPTATATITHDTVQTDQPYTLDPSIANKVLPPLGGAGSAPAAAPSKGSNTPAGADTAQKLLTAYKDAFGGNKVTDEDIQVLSKVSPSLAQAIQSTTTSGKNRPTQNGALVPAGPWKNVQGWWDDLFGGGGEGKRGTPTAPIPKAQVAVIKREAAQAIAKQLPGISSEEILSHDPNDVLDIPVPRQLAASLASQGYAVQVGQPISAAVNKLQPGRDQVAQQTADSGSTAQDQFNELMTQWDSASPAEKSVLATNIAKTIGVPNPNAVTKQQVEQAYTQVVTKAATDGTSVADAMKALGGQLQNPINPQGLQAAEVSPQAAEVQNTAERLGVNLTTNEYNYLVDQATQGVGSDGTTGWSQAQIDQAVGSYFKPPTDANGNLDPTQLSGDAASIYKGFQQILDEYQIPMSNQAVMAHVTQALQASIAGINEGNPSDTTSSFSSGTSAATAAFLQYAQTTAANLYPQFAQQIGRGVTTKTLLDPYAQVAAAILGFGTATGTSASTSEASDAESSLNINWSQPKWARALQGGVNPQNGGPAPMSLDQWRQTLITDPQYGWTQTDDAKNAGVGVADHLLSVFGVPAAQGQ
jgi:hypothetical protein